MLAAPRVSDVRVRIALDFVVLLWVVAWLAVGLLVGREVRGLGDLSETTVTAGRAIVSAGEALETLEDVPFVGADVGAVVAEARAAGQSAIESGRSSRESIHDLSILLAVAIGVVPSLPLVLLYVPLRISWVRTQGRSPSASGPPAQGRRRARSGSPGRAASR